MNFTSRYTSDDLIDCQTVSVLLTHEMWVNLLSEYMQNIQSLEREGVLSHDNASYENLIILFFLKVKKDELSAELIGGEEFDLSAVTFKFKGFLLQQ